MSEFELLRGIYAANAALLARHGTRVVIPPGDDMAQIHLERSELLIAVDQMIEGRHFRSGTPMELVGRKAVARNISDIAAMAGRPLACVAAVALPQGMASGAIETLYDAVRAAAELFDCPLVGGDTGSSASAAAPLVISVTVVAGLPAGVPRAITRGGAKIGDGVFVTGRLGGSFGADGLGRHLTFAPRVEESVALARMLGDRLHAMIDLSDGLGRDAGHLAAASGVAMRLDAGKVPANDGCTWRNALGDGEDYELCFTAEGPVPSEVAGLAIARVGEVIAADSSRPRVSLVTDEGEFDVTTLGWEHGR